MPTASSNGGQVLKSPSIETVVKYQNMCATLVFNLETTCNLIPNYPKLSQTRTTSAGYYFGWQEFTFENFSCAYCSQKPWQFLFLKANESFHMFNMHLKVLQMITHDERCCSLWLVFPCYLLFGMLLLSSQANTFRMSFRPPPPISFRHAKEPYDAMQMVCDMFEETR